MAYEPEPNSAIDDEELRFSAIDPGSPMWMLWLAGGAVGASALVFAFGGGFLVNLIGYLLGSLVAFTLIALFRRATLSRMFVAGVGVARSANTGAAGLLATGLVCACIHAYFIARHYA
jgi:hypothetical protein